MSVGMEPATDEAQPAEPWAIEAEELTVATVRGQLFGGLHLQLRPGDLGVVLGPPSSGRTAALLALCGRMRHVSGTLRVDGVDAIAHPGLARRASAVARAGAVVAPEPTLTIDECITERCLMEAGSPKSMHSRFLHAAEVLGLRTGLHELYGALSPADQTRAALALATIRRSRFIVLDDLDRRASLDEQARLWQDVRALAVEGTALIVSTSERRGLPSDAVVAELEKTR